MKNIALAACLIFAAHSAFCAEQLPAGHPSIPGPSKELTRLSGKVIETINSGGYTYLRLDTGTQKVWAAAPLLHLKVGDAIVIADGMPMPKYHSKTLNRDFDLIYFTGDLTVNGSRPVSDEKPVELPKNHPPLSGAAPAASTQLSGIKKASGGKTIEEVYAGKTKLSGHQVTVRGKVVKYNEMILGKNWIHLRDGTGSKGNNDLLITSSAPAKIVDTVLATGTIAVNKDFGSNYKYDVMIEDAKIVIEK